MRNLIIFVIVFFAFDRFMNYQLNHHRSDQHKHRIFLAHSIVNAAQLDEKAKSLNKTFNDYKRMFLANFFRVKEQQRGVSDILSSHSSNRSV